VYPCIRNQSSYSLSIVVAADLSARFPELTNLRCSSTPQPTRVCRLTISYGSPGPSWGSVAGELYIIYISLGSLDCILTSDVFFSTAYGSVRILHISLSAGINIIRAMDPRCRIHTVYKKAFYTARTARPLYPAASIESGRTTCHRFQRHEIQAIIGQLVRC